MSKLMKIRWKQMQIDKFLKDLSLTKKLNGLAESPLLETSNGVVLRPLASPAIIPNAFPDRTGYEAFINKIHVSDFVDQDEPKAGKRLSYLLAQGVLYANKIKARLSGRPEKFRILLSLDPDSKEVTVRFFMLRPNEQWGPDNIDELTVEEIIVLET